MSPLEKLAALVGVASGYTDAFGQPVETSLEVRRGLLAALGGAPLGDEEGGEEEQPEGRRRGEVAGDAGQRQRPAHERTGVVEHQRSQDAGQRGGHEGDGERAQGDERRAAE